MTNSVARFSNRVANYVKYRPGYPSQVLELFRMQRFPQLPIKEHAQGFVNGITRLASEGFSPEQIAHARVVLSRLARLADAS